MVTGIIVKSAHDHSVLCGLAFLFIYRNFCVTVDWGKQSGHKSKHKSSCQRCFLPSPGCHSNQILLKQCYLCSQQQPPCGETATPSRTQSTDNLRQGGCGAGDHCCREWRSHEAYPLLPSLLLSWRPEKDSKNEKQNKLLSKLTFRVLDQVI